MKRKYFVGLILAAVTQLSLAQSSTTAQATQPAPSASAQADPAGFTEGEIRRIDKSSGRVTIKHGPIKSVDMPPMTMVFTVERVAMLDSFKPGDNVLFTVRSDQGKLTITELKLKP
jgi:Cu/Ag efflux protein CusF